MKELENSNTKNIAGFNERDLQVNSTEILKFWKIKAPEKMIEIETVDHEKITITKDHPIMLSKQGIPVWIKGRDIKENDYLATPEKIPVNRKDTPLDILELIKLFPEKIKDFVEFKFSAQFFSFTNSKNIEKLIPYRLLSEMLKKGVVSIKLVEKNYEGIRVKPKTGTANFHKITFNLNTNFAYLTGLIAGDGHLPKDSKKIVIAQKTQTITVSSLLNTLVSEVLGVPFNKFQKKYSNYVINSTFLYHLIQLFGIPTGNKAGIIDVPNILISQPGEIVQAYIAGLWDSDGCINKHPSAKSMQVSYCSKSEIFIDKLRLLLKTFGMNSAKHTDKRTNVFWLRLSSNAVPKFRDYIFPYLIIKKEKFEKLYNAYHSLYDDRIISQCQQVPHIINLLENELINNNFTKQKISNFTGIDFFNYFGKVDSDHNRLPYIQKSTLEKISTVIDTESKLFSKISTSPIIWKKIKKIKTVNYKKSFVYDITTSTNTFIANGIVSHNCTYHRTDSLSLSQTSLEGAQKFITEHFGKNYSSMKRYKAGKNAQEAHEAIRPTYAQKSPELLKTELEGAQLKLYTLIWQRFIASQMANAIFDSTAVEIKAQHPTPNTQHPTYTFSANGQMLKFDGFLKVYPMKFEENEMPTLKEKEVLDLVKINPTQHFTEPPARYNEASLIKALEAHGIGRPSTYAPTLSTIQDRHYIEKNDQKKFFPTEMGIIVNEILVKNFPEIVDIDFTAKMEKELDEISEGKDTWQKTCRDFYVPFAKNLKEKYEDVKKENLDIKTDKICPKCQKPMVEKLGRFGRFYACTGFPECKHTESLEAGEALNVACPKCKTGAMAAKRSRRGKIFYSCDSYPKCDFALWDKPINEFCEKCNSILVETKNKKIKCSNKNCDFKKS